MANAFFNDTLAPFEGIDIGWGQDPNFPIGEYEVLPDAGAINKQLVLSQNEDDDVVLGAGVLMITDQVADTKRPAGTGTGTGVDFEPSGQSASAWIHSETVIGGEDYKVTVSPNKTYGFWISIPIYGMTADAENAAPHSRTGVSKGGPLGNVVIESFGTGIRLFGSDEYITQWDGVKLIQEGPATSTTSYIYLGMAETDSDNVATFTQNTFGPIAVPAISYLVDIVSEETPHFLTISDQDGGMRTRSLVGADRSAGGERAPEDNLIFEDDEGFLFLDIASNSEAVVNGGIRVLKKKEDAAVGSDYEGTLTITNTGVVSIAHGDPVNADITLTSIKESGDGAGSGADSTPFSGAVLVKPPTSGDRHTQAALVAAHTHASADGDDGDHTHSP